MKVNRQVFADVLFFTCICVGFLYIVHCVVYIAVICSYNDFSFVFTAGVLVVTKFRSFVEAETECLFELFVDKKQNEVSFTLLD